MSKNSDLITIDTEIVLPYAREVFYYETDQMGIVHHSNYIKWIEEARLDLLRQIGLPYDKMEDEGILIPVLEVSCHYKLAFRYGDRFSISSKIEKLGKMKFSLEYEIFHVETGMLHATAKSEHCFVTNKMVPVRVQKEYPDIYRKFQLYSKDNLTNG